MVAASMRWFPAAGLVIGLAVLGAAWLGLQLDPWSGAMAALAVLALALALSVYLAVAGACYAAWRTGRPGWLITWDTLADQTAKAAGTHVPFRIFRPRTIIYATLFSIVGLIMLYGYSNRSILEVNVLHDRNPPAYLRLHAILAPF